MGELERLVAEQRRDIRAGARQPREPGVRSLGGYSESLTYDGLSAPAERSMRRRLTGCPVHGFYDGRICRPCDNERVRTRYRTNRQVREAAIARQRAWRKEMNALCGRST